MKEFSVKYTNIIKGFAICLLLLHHLFYNSNESIIDIWIGSYQLSNILGLYGKVCVAIFLILSGYGIYRSYNSNKAYQNILVFYKKHLTKIYLNYWLIWLIFVPFGVFVLKITLIDIYKENIIKNFIINFLGLQYYFGTLSYNNTWWFIGLIVGLYILFPVLYYFMEKIPVFLYAICIGCMFIPLKFGLISFEMFRFNLLSFIAGMVLARYNIIEKHQRRKHSIYIYLAQLLLLFLLRYFGVNMNIQIDTFIGILLIFIIFEYVDKLSAISNIMELLGKHSFNIFMLHTFIIKIYFHNFIYMFKLPIVIFLISIIICLILSICIEFIKFKLESVYNAIWYRSRLSP